MFFRREITRFRRAAETPFNMIMEARPWEICRERRKWIVPGIRTPEIGAREISER